jgi:hypothetical protein
MRNTFQSIQNSLSFLKFRRRRRDTLASSSSSPSSLVFSLHKKTKKLDRYFLFCSSFSMTDFLPSPLQNTKFISSSWLQHTQKKHSKARKKITLLILIVVVCFRFSLLSLSKLNKTIIEINF